MARIVQIIQRREVFQRFIFRIEEAALRHEKYDGALSEEITRLVLQRGDAVAMLLFDPALRVVLLCEQFRFPAYDKGPGWLLELPAGILEPNEEAESCARREIMEETGYEAKALQLITRVYMSPGGSSERIYIFYGEVDLNRQTGSGGGLAHENEDIKNVLMPLSEAIAMAHDGRLEDAKTVIAILWLECRQNILAATDSATPRNLLSCSG